MWAQNKEGKRAHPPKGPPIRKQFLGPCRACPKMCQKLNQNSQETIFLSPTQAGTLSFFTSINFFLSCQSLVVRACHSSTDPGQEPDKLKTCFSTRDDICENGKVMTSEKHLHKTNEALVNTVRMKFFRTLEIIKT
jgi:hypothetical protein